MSIAVILRNDGDVRGMVPWGARLARAANEPLLVLHVTSAPTTEAPRQVPLYISETNPASRLGGGQSPEENGGNPMAMAIRKAWEESLASRDAPALTDSHDEAEDTDAAAATKPGPAGDIAYFRLSGPQGLDETLEHLATWSVDLLVIPADACLSDTQCTLFHRAACATMLLSSRANAEGVGTIVVPTTGCDHDHRALRTATRLAQSESSEVHAVYVTKPLDEYSRIVGVRAAERFVSLAAPSDPGVVQAKSVVNDRVEQGIREAIPEDCGLVLVGTRAQRSGSKYLHPLAGKLLKWDDGPTVAVLRPAMPLHHRFLHWLETGFEDRLPQLTRDERVELVGRIQGGSQFNVDFMALICLSTLIAAFGLARNQGAVIIGAMLVAPLMTPLMGFGLALMHGNSTLARQSARTVLGGFALALLIGIGVGLLIFSLEPSVEMAGRGSPGVLDLLVAFISGMAAAYAIGRPNLSSALPGVAIAAALVPPIATAGMSLAIGEFSLAAGALLLFLTNIVAISLGAGVGLWAVGIRSRHQHGGYESWSGWVVTALVIITIGLAVIESQPALSVATLPAALRLDLEQTVHQYDTDASLIFGGGDLHEHHGRLIAELHVDSPHPLPQALTDALHKKLTAHLDQDVELQVVTRLTTRASSESDGGK